MELDPKSFDMLYGPPDAESGGALVIHAGAGGGGIEGAKRDNQEMACWAPPIISPSDEISIDKTLIDSRVRDCSINDPYIAAGSRTHRDLIVGAQFKLSAKPKSAVLGQNETWEEEFQEEVEAKWDLIANSPGCYLDATRTKTLTDLVRLAVAMDSAGGEVLASIEWISQRGRPIKTAVQMIDTARLNNPRGVQDDDFLRRGVVLDSWGAPQAYWIQDCHPGAINAFQRQNRWSKIAAYKPWGRPQIIHLFDEDVAEVSRGISKLVSSLKETKMAGKFRDITLQAAVLNATYAASMESDMPPEQVFAAMGAGVLGNDMTARINTYAAAWLGSIGEYIGDSQMNTINGTKIPVLYPGTKLNIKPVGTPGGIGTGYEASLMRSIASSQDLSYEEFSRDLSQSNYSSIKAALGQTQLHMKPRKARVADRFASTIYRCVLEEWIESDQLETVPRSMPRFRDGLNAEAYAGCSWIGGSQGQLDELKETQAASLRGRYGLTTDEVELGRLGLDWVEVYKQRAREKKMRDRLGLEDPYAAKDSNVLNATTGAAREKEGEATDTTEADSTGAGGGDPT